VRLAGGARLAAVEGSAGARVMGRLDREREGVWAGNGPAEGGSVFLFSFLISISYFYFFYLVFF
jgi:hypothetical protein